MSYNPYGPSAYAGYGAISHFNSQNPITSQIPGNNKIIAYVQEDKILADTPDGPKNIGITWDAYQKLDAITSEYYEILKEHDLLPKESSPSEAMNEELLSALKAIKEELKESKEEREQLKSSLSGALKIIDDLTGGNKAHEPV